MKQKKICILLLLFLVSFAYAQNGNTNLGNGANGNITTGDYNVAVGDSALYNISTDRFNVALGFGAGKFNSNFENVFVGFKAGYLNTEGFDNTFLGFLAGYYNTTSGDNTFVGNASGLNNNGGNDNTFVGEASGFRNTTGDDNTFIGHKAGAGGGVTSVNSDGTLRLGLTSDPATGSNNTAVGSEALYSLTTGRRNTAIGRYAGYNINLSGGVPPASVDPDDYGSYNTFVGDSTGIDVGRGAFNTFVGQSAGASTESASRNTFIGYRAGWDNNRTNRDNAHLNTYLGHRAGYSNREGSYNVMIGASVDFNDVGDENENSYNIVMGYDSKVGRRSNRGVNNTIVVGTNTTVNANYTMVFGHDVTATIDSTMVLGGETHRVSVGVGTNTPNIKASLELADTDKGFLINRLTTAQRTAMESNLTADDSGMMVYDNDLKILYVWKGDAWSMSSTDSLEERIQNLEDAATASTTDRTPQKFNYQTSLVNNLGEPLQDQNVNFRISILETSTTGTSVYEETHAVTTTNSGLTSFQIGGGTVVSGVFEDILWESDEYFLKIEVDTDGGTEYQDFGTTQLLSVPYALHARTADRLTGNLNGNLVPNQAKSKTVANKEDEDELATLKNEIAALKKLVVSLQKQIESKK